MESLFRRTSSGRRRSRRECLVGRPRSPFAEGVENKLRRSPRRGLLCDRPLPGRCRSSPPSTSSAYERCLPESRPGGSSVSRPLCEVPPKDVQGRNAPRTEYHSGWRDHLLRKARVDHRVSSEGEKRDWSSALNKIGQKPNFGLLVSVGLGPRRSECR